MAKSRDTRANCQNGIIQRDFWWRRSFGVVLLLLLMLQSKEKARKRRRKVWSCISFEILLSSLRSAFFYVLIWGQSSFPLLLLWLVNTRHQASKIGSALFNTSCVSDSRWQRLEWTAMWHKLCTLNRPIESYIVADVPHTQTHTHKNEASINTRSIPIPNPPTPKKQPDNASL